VDDARWWTDVGDQGVWNIIGVESVAAEFYIPREPLEGAGGGGAGERRWKGTLGAPVTPLPSIIRYVKPASNGRRKDLQSEMLTIL
jgi:hypothetical protein